MGCDIHMHIERREAEGKPWVSISEPTPYSGRNYCVFAALAGVRNAEGIIPIHAPRGIPSDIATATFTDYDEWGEDAHSASWATIAELVLWEGWKQTYTQSWVIAEDLLPRKRLSDERFHEVQDYVNRWGKLPADVAACRAAFPADSWRRISFQEKLADAVGNVWWEFMFNLQLASLGVGPDNTRIVYWFDN